jgi:hypothetical protein
VLIKDIIDPRKLALSGSQVAFIHEMIQHIVRKAIALDDDEALSLRRAVERKRENKGSGKDR